MEGGALGREGLWGGGALGRRGSGDTGEGGALGRLTSLRAGPHSPSSHHFRWGGYRSTAWVPPFGLPSPGPLLICFHTCLSHTPLLSFLICSPHPSQAARLPPCPCLLAAAGRHPHHPHQRRIHRLDRRLPCLGAAATLAAITEECIVIGAAGATRSFDDGGGRNDFDRGTGWNDLGAGGSGSSISRPGGSRTFPLGRWWWWLGSQRGGGQQPRGGRGGRRGRSARSLSSPPGRRDRGVCVRGARPVGHQV